MQAFRQLSIAKDEDHIIDLNKITLDNDRNQNNQGTQSVNSKQHYQQFKKIYLTAFILANEKKRLADLAAELINSLQKIENAHDQIIYVQANQSSKQKKKQQNTVKRLRRKADDIQRQWQCKQLYCDRKYGAYASLLQHIKLKHPNAYEQYCKLSQDSTEKK